MHRNRHQIFTSRALAGWLAVAAGMGVSGCKRETAGEVPAAAVTSSHRTPGEAAESGPDAKRDRRRTLVANLAGLRQESQQSLQTSGRLHALLKDFEKVRFQDIASVLEEAGMSEGSDAFRMALAEFLNAKGPLDPQQTRNFLLEKNDPRLTELGIFGLASASPAEAFEVVRKTSGPFENDCSLIIFTAGAGTQAEATAPLLKEIPDSNLRDTSAACFLTNLPVETSSSARLKAILGDHLEAFSGTSAGDLFAQAGSSLMDLSPQTVAQDFDPGIDWQRRVLLGYWAGCARNNPAIVEAFLNSPAAGRFTQAELDGIRRQFPEPP